MKSISGSMSHGFTLIELLTALIILSLLALMSYRGLGAVLDAREYVRQETEKWRRVTSFFMRFERDMQLAAPRPVRVASGAAPAWNGRLLATPEGVSSPHLEFSRFASTDGMDTARRIGYVLNEKQEIELWLWPGLDVAPGVQPERYPVLTGVATLELQYLNADRLWMNIWPDMMAGSPIAAISSIPQAVRVRIVLASGEEVERIFH